jgi:hypothetical protein
MDRGALSWRNEMAGDATGGRVEADGMKRKKPTHVPDQGMRGFWKIR